MPNGNQLTIGLVCINSGLNISRVRVDEHKLSDGSPSPCQEADQGFQMLPYAVGLLQAYIQRYARQPERYAFPLPVHSRMPVETAVGRLASCDVVGFSAYVWNIRLSQAIARRLKEVQPETLIIFGGPQVPDSAEKFLRANPYIDIAVHGEGEQTFLALAETILAGRSWEDIPSISYLDRGAHFVRQACGPRLRDLSAIPTVYSSGLFDALMAAHPEVHWAGMLETNRGCPFACTFCDWGSATNSRVFRFDLDHVYRELDWFGQRGIEYVFCCDANFGILPRDEEIAAQVSQVRAKYGYPHIFATQNTKNSTERSYRIQKQLSDAGVTAGVTLSFQSLDNQTLENVRRDNISVASFAELQHRYTRDGIPTYTDMILALPGETYDSFLNGISRIVEGGQHNNLFFYNCSILPNAEMSDPDYRQRFGLETVEQEILPVHVDLPQVYGEEVPEFLETVVATKAMPAADWVRAKTIWWMADLVYFGRLLQIPFVMLHELQGLEYGRSIEAVAQADPQRYPLLGSIVDFFRHKAQDIQRGGWEFCPSPEWLNLAWPANQHILIKLVSDNKLSDFYREATGVLLEYAAERCDGFSPLLLADAIRLNRALVRVPFVTNNLKLSLQHNIWEFYQGVLAGVPVELQHRPSHYGIWRTRPAWSRLDHWLEHVVHCQNVKHAYLYPVLPLNGAADEQSSHQAQDVQHNANEVIPT